MDEMKLDKGNMTEGISDLVISLVVPVYCSQKVLPALYQRVVATLEPVQPKFEIIFIEDCGADQSWDIIEQLARKDNRVKGLKLARNYGQHSALLCGIRAARGRIVVTLDDDLQNPPEEIPKMLKKLDMGYDVVYGKPERGQHGFFRNMASRITKLVLQNSMGAETAQNVSAFRVFRTPLRDAFASFLGSNVNIDVLLTWGTNRFTAVNVQHDPRGENKSGYTFRKLVTHAFNMVTGFSTFPLQMASMLGFGFGIGGGLVLCYVMIRYVLEGSSVSGFPFLASIISIFSGVQLIALGIFGEYLARMHFRTMEHPSYVVRDYIGRKNCNL